MEKYMIIETNHLPQMIKCSQQAAVATALYVHDLATRVSSLVMQTLITAYQHMLALVSALKETAQAKVASYIFAARSKYSQDKLLALHEKALSLLAKFHDCTTNTICIPSNGAELDGVEIRPHQHNEKWMVVFLPNKVVWQEVVDPLRKLAVRTKCNLVCCNYRMTGLHKTLARSEDDVIQDGKTVIEYVHNKGVRYQDIHLHGYSLGGAFATIVLHELRSEGKQLDKLANERSFSSLHDVVVAQSFPVIGHIYSLVLMLFGWRLNAAKVIAAINNHKQLPHVKLLVIDHPHDDKIPHDARFLTTLQQMYENRQLMHSFEIIRMNPDAKQLTLEVIGHNAHANSHARIWSEEELTEYVNYVQASFGT
jgi:alpha/beta superfamily hydrolase